MDSTTDERKSACPINPLILNRWSPRAMTGEELTDEEIMPLFEAARWAPSSYNAQPWRFIYVKRQDPDWEKFCDLLMQANRLWCEKASVLVVVASHTVFPHNNKPSITHSFDTGSAWQNLALQAYDMQLATHGMQGFDYEKAKEVCQVPDDYAVEMMIAIGKRGDPQQLPENLQAIEKPNQRNPVTDFVFQSVMK